MISEVRSFARRLHGWAMRRWGRFRFRRSLRPDDVFVATYPKSGTNWVGFFLGSVLAERLGEDPEALTLVNYRRLVPDVNAEYYGPGSLGEYDELPSPRVFTAHAPYDPALPRVVCVVRDPRSVVVSYYYHRRRHEADFDLSLEEFVRRGRTGWRREWAEHVGGWLRHADSERLLVVRYEDLHAAPTSTFGRILDFCGLGLPDDAIRRHVERASFDRMRDRELSFEETEPARPIRFVRSGSTDEWREKLSTEGIALLEDRYGALMDRLGYRRTTRNGGRSPVGEARSPRPVPTGE